MGKELLQATIKIKIKYTKSRKNAQKRDIENISQEHKETARQKGSMGRIPRISGKRYETQLRKQQATYKKYTGKNILWE